MAKIITVYNSWHRSFDPSDMSYIRWLKISEALARRGHQVDIATNEFRWWSKKSPIEMAENLRRVPLGRVQWDQYDVIKTLFHIGFETLEAFGGANHPFIIAKLGSVVGPKDMEGIYFYGEQRKRLYSIQQRIHRNSKYVTVLSSPAKDLWQQSFDGKDHVLIVQGGVDREIPTPLEDPYPDKKAIRCLFAGHVYTKNSQPEANRVLIDKLNKLGYELSRYGSRLYMLGSGDVSRLNREHITYLGITPYKKAWDYFHFANVGVVVAAGKFNHNNESSKIYHYLRAGLPVVSEAGFPNDNVIHESKLGFVTQSGNLELMAEKIAEAARIQWDKDHAMQYILNHHTWDSRVEVYDQLLKMFFSSTAK